jgi:predicted exporter
MRRSGARSLVSHETPGNMNANERRRLIFGVVLVAGLLVYVTLNFRVTTDISHFLPDTRDDILAEVSRQIADSELSRTMILALEAPDARTAALASRDFEAALLREPRVADSISFLEGGPPEGIERALFELYEPRRLSFLGLNEEAARARLDDEGLRAAARTLRNELAGPLSSLTSRVAPRDPFLTIPALFKRLERSRASDLSVVDGRFMSADGRTAILFMGTRASAMDASAQAPLLEGVSDAFVDVETRSDVPLRLDQSGLNRFATWAALAIERDVKRVSIVSSVVLCILLVFLFRSLRFVGLAAIPVGVGVLAGCAAVLAVFGRLHGITLAFGASLIGVSIDYVVHLYCHHSIVRPVGGARASLRVIMRPLATGAITTTAGFAALSGSALVGLREVACFAVVGILSAFVATIAVLPSLIPDAVTEVRMREVLVRRVGLGFNWLTTHRARVAGLPAFAILFVVIVLPGARWNSDLASLNRMDADLMEEDARVQARVARFEQMRFVVSIGVDEARALDTNDIVASRLRDAIASGELKTQRTLASLLPGPTSQLAIARVAFEDPSLAERLRRVFHEEGFAEGAIDPFLDSLDDPLPEPLNFDDLLDSPAGALVRSFRVGLGDRVGFITYLHGVEDAAAIGRRLADVEGAVFLRQSDLFNSAQLEYQQSTIALLGWGLLAVLFLLALRYRQASRTLVSFLPSIIAAGVTVSVLTLIGRGLDLISLTALLFVVSMGVDYSVFLVDAYDEPDSKSVVAALCGALLACFSTVVAFGLLAMSDHPVLSNLGLTAAVGIASSLVLAPTMLLFVRRKESTE